MSNANDRELAAWVLEATDVIIRIGLIAVGAYVAGRILSKIVDRVFQPRNGDKAKFLGDQRKLGTLRSLTKSIIRYALYFVGGLMILSELGVDTASLVAGAGIVGVALGFGAQNLVRDVLSGFFVLFEDQYAVGDYVTIAGISGIVEEMGLRITKLRDFAGEVHIIPNGVIDRVTNYRGQSMRVMFDVVVPYSANPSQTIKVLQRGYDERASEIENIVEGPRVLGVQDLGTAGMALRVWAKAVPMQQWAVGRALKLLTVEILAENGIQVPYPRTIILKGNDGESAYFGAASYDADDEGGADARGQETPGESAE
ncbi:MAG: mechanosensitive ion channel family protein [Bacillota bacterium]|nr:mechanosensitive ion channel family protein [Bacillota bacterium]